MIDKKFRNDPKYKIVPTQFGDAVIDVIYRKLRKPSSKEEQLALPPEERDMFTFVAPFNQRTYVAAKGIICHQDQAVTLRDGTVIYCDIFLPEDSGPVPIICAWSPFGKRPGDGLDEWQLMGVGPGTVSRLAKFESADPEYWCRCGYGIANVDPRGIGHSEGDAVFMGTAEGRDGYDFIEWCAAQPWCDGRIGMFGNSGAGMAQLRIAAEQPPHLTCIAPWEATGDLFRESNREGGIESFYPESVIGMVAGNGYIEDTLAMSNQYDEWNEYWADKVPQYANIRIPTYYTACWNHFHVVGSFEGFSRIRSRKKWMRAHREFEWPDTYNRANIADLRLFFDRYLKDIRNGWETTPRIRLEVMDIYDYDYQSNRPEKEFPLARTRYEKLYLSPAEHALSFEPCAEATSCRYDGNTQTACFDYRFTEDTEITGYMKLKLFVSVEGHDDTDIFVAIKKLGQDGGELPLTVLGEPHPGAWGKLRASRRRLDEGQSTELRPVQSYGKPEKLAAGEIVALEIPITPYSRIWHKGESLRIELAGRYLRDPGWFERLGWATDNQGMTVIHGGGKYDSHLLIPVIPPKYRCGEFIYR